MTSTLLPTLLADLTAFDDELLRLCACTVELRVMLGEEFCGCFAIGLRACDGILECLFTCCDCGCDRLECVA